MEAGDKDFKDRFMREIASLATLEHAHIVTTVDWGEIEGIPFLVLRYLSGGSLRDRITDTQGFYKPMPLEGLNQWLPQIASALDFIHTKNWVHRDLKPDNILFDEAGNPYLADFGIAKALEGAPMGVKTTMGAFIGTPQYMAPEMHLGKGIGPRADQFGLAVLVYEALAGKIPFAGATPTAIFVEVMQGKARPIHELVPGIALEKSNALMKGIMKEPRDRYGSCLEFANAVTGSMLARGSSSTGSETPSRVVIPGTRMETPKKPDIPGTRIETPSKLEIAGTRIEKSGSRLDVRLRSEDYLTRAGLGLEQLCKDLVEAGKVTKELFLEARKFCKSNDFSGLPGGVLLAEKIESIVKIGHVSMEISEEIVSLARDILGLGIPVIAGKRLETPSKPEIAGTRLETPSKPEIAGTRLERKAVKAPVIKEPEKEKEDELQFERQIERRREKKGNNSAVFVLVGVIGGIALLGIVLIIALGGKKAAPEVVNTESVKEESIKEESKAKAKQMELVKLKQEEEAKVKQMELVKLKQEEEAKFAAIEKEMVLIAAGRFMMGSPESEKNRDNDETQHEVTITKPYYMGKYEVTQEQWKMVMGDSPSNNKEAKFPVTNVSWADCQEFIKKLNSKTSGGFRLPTEAEWEYACRAGTSTAYTFGDSLTKGDANYGDGAAGRESIKATGNFKPNAFGLYDMHGNVWEWCEDWKADYPRGAVTDPKGPATGECRVLRGGSFDSFESKARSSVRVYFTPAYRLFDFGFRLARTTEIKTAAPKPDHEGVMPAIGNILIAPFTETKAKEAQKEVAISLQREVEEKEDLGKGINLEMVLIPAGKFKMGSPASEKGRDADETQHEVTLTKPYYMGKYEVTQEQWESVMGSNPSSRTKGAKLPVTDVSWNDCQEFTTKLNKKTSGGFRLPTEAEWEYACRAGTTTAYSVGNSLTKADANSGDGSEGSIKAVGNYKPNAFRLYDMHGNVWEWCNDWHGSLQGGEVKDPIGTATGEYRVLRGGSFVTVVSSARSSNRSGELTPTGRGYYGVGFRLARTTEIKAAALKPDPAVILPATVNLLVAPFSEAKAKEVQKSVAKSLQKGVEEKEDLGKGIKLEMVLIPAGKFKMGSGAFETGRKSDETQHEVTLTKPYYMGKYEITQEKWESVMGKNPSSTKGVKLPVTDISWNDCQEFIEKLNAKTNSRYRLQTEAEWEYVCRAGTITAYSFEDKINPNDANYDDSKIGKPVTVGIYKPNAFGIYDMHGNVWEWCEDRKANYSALEVTDPKGSETGISRVLRGGSFSNYESLARSSSRREGSPIYRSNVYGFRLARTP
jgi:formylglycine-generating enzyme required for sulfatase activity/serine/threonine protein kinase